MKKSILSILTTLAVSSLSAQEYNVNITAGWQLLGTQNCINDMSVFNKNSISTVWTYDKVKNNWQIYIPSEELNNVAQISSIEIISSINENTGFWVSANYDDILTLITSDSNDTVLSTPPSLDMNLSEYPVYDLTQEQKDGLVFMYQEEKVARDVYNAMYEKWGNKVFSNIAKSEQSHMDAVKAILDKYNLTVPNDTLGAFELQELQELYNNLITMGSVSSNEAMKVGVLVEQTDIADLLERIEDAPEDIKVVYQNLLNGSYNHLNAFSKQVY